MRTRAKRGFAMLLVMVLVGMAVILGMSYLSVASLHAGMSRNYRQAARARYLAESGLEHALYICRFHPEQIDGAFSQPLGPYYLNDDTSAQYTISARSEGLNKYTLLATAVVGGVWQGNQAVGGIRRTSSLTLTRAPVPRATRSHGLFISAGGNVQLPGTVQVNGNLYVSNELINYAAVSGNVYCSGAVLDPLHLIGGLIYQFVEPVQAPTISVQQYVQYGLNGKNYSAITCNRSTLSQNGELAGGRSITATNPGGVVYLCPTDGSSVKLTGGLNFQGTLIIDGDIVINGSNINLTAVDGYPAIVASGAVRVDNSCTDLVINGLVAADGGIVGGTGDGDNSSLTINGALYGRTGGYASTLKGTHVLNYQSALAQVYDFSLPAAQRVPKVTVTRWND